MATNLCSYEQFKENVREADRNGTLKMSYKGEPIHDFTELEWAIQYAICHLWEDGERTFTIEELYEAIGKYCGEEVKAKCLR